MFSAVRIGLGAQDTVIIDATPEEKRVKIAFIEPYQYTVIANHKVRVSSSLSYAELIVFAT